MKAATWACPNCRTALQNIPGAHAGVMACERCQGRAVDLNLLHKVSDPKLIADLWHRAKALRRASGKPCPACRRPAWQVNSGASLGKVDLDLCPHCHLVWFDRGELDKVPKSTVKPTAPDTYSREMSSRLDPPLDGDFDIVDAIFRLLLRL